MCCGSIASPVSPSLFPAESPSVPAAPVKRIGRLSHDPCRNLYQHGDPEADGFDSLVSEIITPSTSRCGFAIEEAQMRSFHMPRVFAPSHGGLCITTNAS